MGRGTPSTAFFLLRLAPLQFLFFVCVLHTLLVESRINADMEPLSLHCFATQTNDAHYSTQRNSYEYRCEVHTCSNECGCDAYDGGVIGGQPVGKPG